MRRGTPRRLKANRSGIFDPQVASHGGRQFKLMGMGRWWSLVLVATFGLTLVRDLITGIVAGCVIAALLAVLRRPTSEEGA